MRQIALSLFVIASSGAYVWDQAGKDPAGDIQPLGQVPAPAAVAPALPSLAIEQQSVLSETPATPPTTVVSETMAAIAAKPAVAEVPSPPASRSQVSQASFAIKPVAYIPIPKPKPDHRQAPPRLIKAGMKSSVNSGAKPIAHGFADGTYIGPVTDAYYGLIQIQASIRGGRLTALRVLRFPSDRRTSIYINRQALPMLRDEAISAQSADVDIISGATLTSRAFIQSLGGALKNASS
jgi:uncharacterized protein with FMN-binding domain